MAQNIFMTSMYFFIPLERISNSYLRNTQLEYNEIPRPAFVRNTDARCVFARIPFGNSDNSFHYSYWTANSTPKEITRHIHIKAYLLNYRSAYNCQREMPLLMIGTTIDKLFPVGNLTGNVQSFFDSICTEDDLVNLKWAFTADEGLFSDNSSAHSFQIWLKKLISRIEGRKERNDVNMLHSIVDVKALKLDIRQIGQKSNLDDLFTKQYYHANISPTNTIIIPSVSQALDGNYRAFAYGLLFGNTNYDRVPPQEIASIFKHAYSNNTSEVTVCAPKCIVFINTHYPFRHCTKEHLQEGFDGRFRDVQNIYEMCEAIYAERRVCIMRHSLSLTHASTIIETLLNLARYMERDLFQLVEMDRKVDYIFEALGINAQFATLKEMAEMAAKSSEIRMSTRLNYLAIIIAVLSSSFALVQLLLNK